jgi:hypothetical protein
MIHWFLVMGVLIKVLTKFRFMFVFIFTGAKYFVENNNNNKNNSNNNNSSNNNKQTITIVKGKNGSSDIKTVPVIWDKTFLLDYRFE